MTDTTLAFDDALVAIREEIAANDVKLQDEIAAFKARVANSKLCADDIMPSDTVLDDWTSHERASRLVHKISILKGLLYKLLCLQENEGT